MVFKLSFCTYLLIFRHTTFTKYQKIGYSNYWFSLLLEISLTNKVSVFWVQDVASKFEELAGFWLRIVGRSVLRNSKLGQRTVEQFLHLSGADSSCVFQFYKVVHHNTAFSVKKKTSVGLLKSREILVI